MHGIGKFKRNLYFSLVLFIQLLSVDSLYAEGLVAGTLVATPTGYVPIEQLKKKDVVLRYAKTLESKWDPIFYLNGEGSEKKDEKNNSSNNNQNPNDPKDPRGRKERKEGPDFDKYREDNKDVIKDEWENTTAPGTRSDRCNLDAKMSQRAFENNLRANGWRAQRSKDGKVNIYRKGDEKITVREFSASTDGPSADCAVKTGLLTGILKIRFIQ